MPRRPACEVCRRVSGTVGRIAALRLGGKSPQVLLSGFEPAVVKLKHLIARITLVNC